MFVKVPQMVVELAEHGVDVDLEKPRRKGAYWLVRAAAEPESGAARRRRWTAADIGASSYGPYRPYAGCFGRPVAPAAATAETVRIQPFQTVTNYTYPRRHSEPAPGAGALDLFPTLPMADALNELPPLAIEGEQGFTDFWYGYDNAAVQFPAAKAAAAEGRQPTRPSAPPIQPRVQSGPQSMPRRPIKDVWLGAQ